MVDKKNDVKDAKDSKHEKYERHEHHELEHEKPLLRTAVKPVAKAVVKQRCFGPKSLVTPPATIGALWADHPWVAMNPDYTNHIFHEIPACPYPKHTVLLDEENGIQFMKHLGDIGMDASGFIKGLFWVATAIPDTGEPPPEPQPPQPQTVTVTLTPAQVLSLATAPVLLIAPGAGESIELLDTGITLVWATTPYVVGPADALVIRQTDATGSVVSSTLNAVGFLDQTTSNGKGFTPAVGAIWAPDAPLVLHLQGVDPTGGDSTVSVALNYKVHPAAV